MSCGLRPDSASTILMPSMTPSSGAWVVVRTLPLQRFCAVFQHDVGEGAANVGGEFCLSCHDDLVKPGPQAFQEAFASRI